MVHTDCALMVHDECVHCERFRIGLNRLNTKNKYVNMREGSPENIGLL
jgi:hypothetical protein